MIMAAARYKGGEDRVVKKGKIQMNKIKINEYKKE